jgi:hypothetical protein
MNKLLLILSLLIFTISCETDKSREKKQIKDIYLKTNLKIPKDSKKIGEITESYDFDYIRIITYKIPDSLALKFVNDIDIKGDSLNEKGYWRQYGKYLKYQDESKFKSTFYEMEYSMISNVLIIRDIHI